MGTYNVDTIESTEREAAAADIELRHAELNPFFTRLVELGFSEKEIAKRARLPKGARNQRIYATFESDFGETLAIRIQETDIAQLHDTGEMYSVMVFPIDEGGRIVGERVDLGLFEDPAEASLRIDYRSKPLSDDRINTLLEGKGKLLQPNTRPAHEELDQRFAELEKP